LYVLGPTLEGTSRYSGCMPTGQRESELRSQARRINREIDAALEAHRASLHASEYEAASYALRSRWHLVLDGLV